MNANRAVLYQVLYIVPSVALYTVEVYVMFFGAKKSKFNKSCFNRIFFIYAVNNLIAEVLYYFFFRMSKAPIFSELFQNLLGHHISLMLLWQLLFYTSMITNLLDLILSLNRFTAALTPIRYKTFWDRKLKWVVIIIIIVPFACLWPISFEGFTLEYVNDSNAYYMLPKKTPTIEWPYPSNILGTCATITCLSCLFCNAYVGYKLCRRRSLVRGLTDPLKRVYFLFMICILLTQVLSCSTQVI